MLNIVEVLEYVQETLNHQAVLALRQILIPIRCVPIANQVFSEQSVLLLKLSVIPIFVREMVFVTLVLQFSALAVLAMVG